MNSNFFNELRRLFEKFPGIGPRQANRFIWAMLDFSEDEQKNLASAIAELPKHLKRCNICWRAFTVKADEKICSFCAPLSKRDSAKIMVVEKDNDLLNIERAGAYNGLYHVLGGMIDPLDENPIVRERIKKLYKKISLSSTLGVEQPKTPSVFPSEIILALSPTKMGEFTSNYIAKVLEPTNVKITRLARGLATGTELEYADETTLRQALDNRK